MLIRDYSLRLSKPKCNVFSERVHAQALLRDDVTDVMPYLNATVTGARYSPGAPALLFEYAGRGIAVWPREIAVDQCDGEADAREVVDAVCRLINDTWERRESIEPNREGYRELTAMEVYRLLPGTNCRECGEAACLAFAVKLASRQASVEACRPLFGGEYEEKRTTLLAELAARGYAVPEPSV